MSKLGVGKHTDTMSRRDKGTESQHHSYFMASMKTKISKKLRVVNTNRTTIKVSYLRSRRIRIQSC